jgi:ligand-binding sensor domain-containing protein
MDKSENLWLTQSGVSASIKIIKSNGNWIVNPVAIDAPVTGDIIITTKGQKWIVLPRGYGLFILDDNKTPDIFTDDKFKKMLVMDTENQVISFVYSIAEDLEGNIWVGTDQGPVIYFNPDNVFNSDLKASRIKVPRNDGTNLADYMLKTETITSIAVDGANRKWLATASSGAYLLSADGTTQIKNFNEQNSPLLSNSIISLAVDNKTGEIWFGTSKGIQSYRGDATAGEEKFKKVYTFPNPVRADFKGNVTITGLIRDSQIRITDISGNLVYETVSDGGQATWDLTTYNGHRVATGVYLVFCASKDGSQSCVTKMLVIK